MMKSCKAYEGKKNGSYIDAEEKREAITLRNDEGIANDPNDVMELHPNDIMLCIAS